MSNLLANETSPYLLQHKDNPVDWHPWSEAALNRAHEEDRPLLVSIGYSACHWCHVMEHESFADPEIAKVMNELYVCVKVDREERPDIDAIYMDAIQAMTGRGGWPLNIFLTPDQVPFYGGTYFPPEPRHGMPSWQQVLLAVDEAWRTRRDEVETQAEGLRKRLAAVAAVQPAQEPIEAGLLDLATARLQELYDPVHGGFGGAPKFPPASAVEFLLARGEREVALTTLKQMASGGIYDQVGGGFARYSVDARWEIPHFEKMLYDNALLARTYLHGWQVAKDELLLDACCGTLDWMLRELQAPEGGFYSALDADSEREEGKFYAWSLEEIRQELGELSEPAIAYFGISEEGNFEGKNVLLRRGKPPERLAEIRCKLFGARERRIRPNLDDKQLTSWNALAISALAEAGTALGRDNYLSAARTCADFILDRLRTPEGRLLRSYNHGRAHLNGYLEDYAFLIEALISLYEATFETKWLTTTRELADTTIELFLDPDNGGFFTTASDHEQLVVRRKDFDDAPIPSGNSSAAAGLLKLAALTGEDRYEQYALGVLKLSHRTAAQHPTAFGHLLQTADMYLSGIRQVVVVGDQDQQFAKTVRQLFAPRAVLAGSGEIDLKLLADKVPIDGQPTAYVCERFSCLPPVHEADALKKLLNP